MVVVPPVEVRDLRPVGKCVLDHQMSPDSDASKSCILYETRVFPAKNTECSIEYLLACLVPVTLERILAVVPYQTR